MIKSVPRRGPRRLAPVTGGRAWPGQQLEEARLGRLRPAPEHPVSLVHDHHLSGQVRAQTFLVIVVVVVFQVVVVVVIVMVVSASLLDDITVLGGLGLVGQLHDDADAVNELGWPRAATCCVCLRATIKRVHFFHTTRGRLLLLSLHPNVCFLSSSPAGPER